MGKALYRQYRSRSLDEVVGQSHVVEILRQAIETGKVSHAYLLTGPRGVGKTSVARIMAHAINKLPYKDEPHLDIIEIDAASNRRIDDIRDLREKVHIAPTSAPYKVYIIDEVHMLTGESFNALLKTLEEPPAHVIFILATTELHKVPATIVSRTQRFHFKPASTATLVDHLRSIATKEKISITEDALTLIAQRGDGSFRDSISLLDQLASLTSHIDASVVEATLGLAPQQLLGQLTAALEARDTGALIRTLKQADEQGISAVTLSDQLIHALTAGDSPDASVYVLVDQLLDVKQSHEPLLKLTAILVKWLGPPHKVSAARSSVTPTVTFSAPHPAPKPASKPAPAPAAPESPARPAAPAAAADAETNVAQPAGELDWDKVMTALKSRHAPLYSVMSRADIDASTDRITLTFSYALHRKKLENAVYRNQLMSVIKNTCGVTPELVLEGGVKAKPQPTKETEAVADIMGGGEVINAS